MCSIAVSRNSNNTLTLTLASRIRIITKIYYFFPWPTCHLSTEFCKNRLSSFCIILLTNKRTNADENITSLAEIVVNGSVASVL